MTFLKFHLLVHSRAGGNIEYQILTSATQIKLTLDSHDSFPIKRSPPRYSTNNVRGYRAVHSREIETRMVWEQLPLALAF